MRKKGCEEKEMGLCDKVVYVGVWLMRVGMVRGGLWGKEGWGD